MLSCIQIHIYALLLLIMLYTEKGRIFEFRRMVMKMKSHTTNPRILHLCCTARDFELNFHVILLKLKYKKFNDFLKFKNS
jgi:hypothetical protein